MMNMSTEVEAVMDKWIHTTYAKKAGLLQHEYKVIFDDRADFEVNIKAGKVIIIAIRYTPLAPEFRPTLRHVFEDFPLKDFLRGVAGITRTGGPQWYELSMSGVAEEPAKKNNMHSFTQRYVTSLEMTDKKTKRSVMVRIEGGAFAAQAEALKLLYGDRLT